MVLIHWIIWTLEVFTCKHFGSRCFGYVRFFNIQEVQVEKCFLEPDGYPTSPGMGEGPAPGVLTVIVPASSPRHDPKLLEGGIRCWSCCLSSTRRVHLCLDRSCVAKRCVEAAGGRLWLADWRLAP